MKGAIGDVLVLVGQVASPLAADIAVAVVLVHVLEGAKEHVQIHVMLEVVEDGKSKLTMKSIKDFKSFQKNKTTKGITFIVTKDCQLACKYCYLVGKNSKERLSYVVAKQAVDYILVNKETFTEDSVIWDFIGGEPFLEIELIDRICDYIKTEMFRLNHHWFNSYRFSFSTNGINYHTDAVQRFVKKNREHLSIGITIDGTKKKHDLNRIWKGDGPEHGSYEDVVRNIPLWLAQFPPPLPK